MACDLGSLDGALRAPFDLGRHVLGQAGGGGVAAAVVGHDVEAGFLEGGHIGQERAALGVHDAEHAHLVLLDEVDDVTGVADVDRDVVAEKRGDGL